MLSHTVILGTYAESADDLSDVILLAKSLRTFGGRFATTPVTVYATLSVAAHPPSELAEYGVAVQAVDIPAEITDRFLYAGKPFAAARAEVAAAGAYELLVWLDCDTLILKEPTDFDLRYMKSLAYRPVMHNRAGSLYDADPSPYWQRIFELSGISEERLFVMHSQADEQRIRPFFQAGSLVVRPELGIFQKWAATFEVLAADEQLRGMCEQERTLNVFLHQAALVGPVVNLLARDELLELSEAYSYPMLFERGYDSGVSFNDLTNVATARRVVARSKLGDDWVGALSGPPETLAWLKEHLA